MKNEKKIIRIMWVIAILPLIVTIVMFNRLPQQIPMHWDFQGQVDSWYPKFPGAFILPAIAIIITAMVSIVPKLDPKRENYEKFKPQYLMIRFLLVIIFVVLDFVTIAISMGAEFIRVDFVAKLIAGILFIVIGNLMPKFKHNYFVGIKTPWTLSNEDVWQKTHRHGGMVWFAAGFACSVLAFIPGLTSAIIYFSIIIFASVEPLVFSYIKSVSKR